jgi:HSP20 family protein
MFGLTRWSPFEDMLNFHREVDRLFNQFRSDLPSPSTGTWGQSFQVRTSHDAWTVEVPLPGIDPEHVTLEAAGNSLSIRVKQDEDTQNTSRYEQTITVPQFLDLEKITASHRHGMLVLTIPVKEAVKPRRIAIEPERSDAKRLNAAA